MKRNIAKCVSDKASVHTGNASAGTIFAPKQDCCDPLLKMERPILGRF